MPWRLLNKPIYKATSQQAVAFMGSRLNFLATTYRHSNSAAGCIQKTFVDIHNYMCKHVAMLTDIIHALPDEWRDVSGMFVAMGDEQRQRILLTFEPGERLNVTQIVSASTLSRTAVSHHLKILRQAGALQSEKIGKEVYFWINKEHITETLQRVLDYVKNNT